MIRKAITTGIVGGLLVTLGALYPILTVFVPALVPGWEPPTLNAMIHASLLMISAVVGLAALILTPIVAVSNPARRGFWLGAQAGGVAGLFMGMVVSMAIAAPINNLIGWSLIRPFVNPIAEPGAVEVVRYLLRLFNDGLIVIAATLIISILFAALLGGFVNGGRPKRGTEPAHPTLYQLSLSDTAGRWFATQDDAATVALAIGLASGLVFAFTELQSFYFTFDQEWPGLRDLMLKSLNGVLVLRSIPFPPLAVSALLLMGIVVVALIKNPTGRYWQRVMAVVGSLDVAVFVWYLQASRTVAFYTGVGPFLVTRSLAIHPNPAMQAAAVATAEALTLPQVQILLAFASPWLAALAVGLTVSIIGFAFGMIYATLVPLIVPRPIDFAWRLRPKLDRDPAQILPTLYQLFNRNSQAYEVLAHLCIGLHHQPDLSRLVAAYHTLGTSDPNSAAANHGKLVADIADLIQKHPEWRHSKEIGSAYRSLSEILTTDSMEAILQIQAPADIGTATVPPLIVKSIGRITGIIAELQKVNRVSDLPSRLTFLNNALEGINAARRFVRSEMSDRRQTAAPYPERPALFVALDRWEEMVLITQKMLKGRADVVASLKSNRVTQTARLPINFLIQNQGLNVAERIRLKLLPGADYFITPPGEVSLDILPASENHEAMLFVEPRPEAKRLRLEWEVSYNDSIEASRVSKFADVAEFVKPDRPFQRIFPIPYVTGTPLKDGDVFVGRQDIFAFVKENLIGKSQNNVLILHGQRRTGKTSVLYRLGHVLKDTHVAVLVDMQGKPARGAADFLFSIADDIVYALELEGIEAPLPEKKDFEESPEFFFRSRFIRSLYPLLGKRNLLLLFDEFEELQRRVDEGKLDAAIFQFLRNMMQHEDKVDFIFAGTHKLEELGSGYWSVLFNIALYKPVTFLSPTEVRRLITEPVAKYDLEYDPLAIDAVIALTAGHPYFTQLLLHEIVAYHNESQRSYMTAADIEQAFERVLERGEAHFKYIWTESTPEEQTVMRMLAEALVGRSDINVPDLQNFGAQCGCAFGNREIEALSSLVGRDIVRRSGKLYRFTVPLIEKWVHRTHPVMA